MARYESEYQALGPYEEEEEDETDENELPVTEQDVLVHVCPESNKGNWNHIEDLDDFFTRVYSYHQRGGFICMILEDILQLFQFFFIATCGYFMGYCVDYPVLFQDKNSSQKIQLSDAILPADQCIAGLGSAWYIVCLTIIFCCFSLFYCARVVLNIIKYSYIRNFYINALKISSGQLPNMTWHEVQARLLEVQKEHQMCVHKRELTQLDIYHRILRFKNYMVAMVNVNTLPLKYNLPFVGEYAYLSFALKYNLDLILFWHWGIGAPFENNWHLQNEYRNARNKTQATKKLESRIFWFGMVNLIFSPLIIIWNCLYFFFRYAELVKRNPGVFGARRWSNYSRLYLRHFNELDHELNVRLNKGYQPVCDYLNIFNSTLGIILAKHVVFMAGSVVAILIILTVIDEDVLNVHHVLSLITGLGVVTAAAKNLIPQEHTVHSPEMLLRNVAMAIHYMPENWAGYAHTTKIRDAFSTLFQFKFTYIMEELLSPIITPFILLFYVRPRASNIVDFLRMFTVEVVGVGDICSFAQMDVRKHGNSKWQVPGQSSQSTAPKNHQAENGKTEMSLMHFHMTNPEWKPDADGSVFINNLRSQVHRDFQARSMLTIDPQQHSMVSPSMMLPSLVTLQPVGPYTSMMSSLNGPLVPPSSANQPHGIRLKGGVSHIEGPLLRPANTSLFGSMHTTLSSSEGLTEGSGVHASLTPGAVREVDECTRELMTNEMNINALFMHELRWRRNTSDYLSLEDYTRAIWQSSDGSAVGSAYCPAGGQQGHSVMPGITEEGSADDEREVDTSRLSPLPPPPPPHLPSSSQLPL
ncbi:autophagy-related protein 9A-like [Babylonia areolata]|uniref:autophagy-related protein 9A-like n=1 Tax=Babylonia areolata TaxID=304850 RepID=UPI003FD54D0C